MPRKRYLLALSVILAAFGAGAWVMSQPVPPPTPYRMQGPITKQMVGEPVVILGDSIARGCCATVGPESYLREFGSVGNLARDGGQIARATALVPALSARLAFVHVGVNDIERDNPSAEQDMAALLAAIRNAPRTNFVVDAIGPLHADAVTPEREALRERMNAQLLAFHAPNVRVVPYVATSTVDGLHPDAAGYAQQMPWVIAALRWFDSRRGVKSPGPMK